MRPVLAVLPLLLAAGAAEAQQASRAPPPPLIACPPSVEVLSRDEIRAPNGWEVRPEPARALFEWAATNELTVLLNPGSRYGKDFPAFELRRFLRGQWV